MTWNTASARSRVVLAASVLVGAGLLAACRGRAAPPAPPPTAVEVVTLQEKPVEQSTELVGTVKSRRSTTVQPQVEGFVTKIFVRSGDRVAPGKALMQIDASAQQAAVSNLESQVAGREADLRLAQQEAARLKTLLAAGAASQAEKEQADTALLTADSQLKAAEAQVRQQRVTLGYHTVSAPTAGVVGDVPVRVGDSVTKSTVLTNIDQNAGLEVYVNVPVQEAKQLKLGLPVHLLGDDGHVLTTATISFVAPSVDGGTQSILAKAWLDAGLGLRTDQFVRARMVWTKVPALTVPLVAVSRINGQYFAFVAKTEGDKTVARQRQVELGALVGNDYVVKSGLKAGEKLIVTGVQKVADGAPVNPKAPASPTAPGNPAATASPAATKGE